MFQLSLNASKDSKMSTSLPNITEVSRQEDANNSQKTCKGQSGDHMNTTDQTDDETPTEIASDKDNTSTSLKAKKAVKKRKYYSYNTVLFLDC